MQFNRDGVCSEVITKVEHNADHGVKLYEYVIIFDILVLCCI